MTRRVFFKQQLGTRILLIVGRFGVPACIVACLLLMEGVSSAQELWSDTFLDSSRIESSSDVNQITDATAIGTSFTPYPGNPLLTLETCDPWDGNGPTADPLNQIPGSVQPDVLYFPEGMDGYTFWMVFTPLDDTPPPGVSAVIPPQIPESKYGDYWWERPTLVRSNDGINWEKTSDYTNPLVSPGSYGTWDGNAELCDPDLVYAPGRGPDGESWFLYYVGQGPTGSTIGVALSHDGLHYTKYAGNPVIPNYSACPGVVYDQNTGTFHAWFSWGGVSSNGRAGYATSPDGLNWTPHNGNWDSGVVVVQPTPGTYDQGGISHLDVIYYQDQYWMYYLAQPTFAYAGNVIGLATSPDGINWIKNPQPVMTPGETWTFYQPPWLGPSFVDTVKSNYRPTAVVVEDTMYLYYGGTDSYSAYPANTYETGLAFSNGPDGHIELQSDLTSAEYASKPDTMVWYHMNEDPSPPPSYPGEYAPLDQTLAWYHMNEDPSVPNYPGEYASLDQTLAWYHFNEGDGLTAEDSGGVINDVGTLNEPARVAGLYGNALSFDGNDAVTVPNSAELNPSNAITIEAWVNPSLNKAVSYVISKLTPGEYDYSYGINLSNGEIQTFIRPASGGGEYYANGGSVTPGTWTHVAMTYEMNPTGDAYITVYQNGVEVSYTVRNPIPANTSILSNTGPLNIGSFPTGAYYYEGLIDEVRIAGRALAPAEIAADGLIEPQLVLDASGNGNNGVPVSPAWTAGLYGNGLSFDGNDIVTVADSPELNPTAAITIEAWVNPSVNKPVDYVVSKVTPGTNDYTYGLYLYNGEIQAFIKPASGSSEYYSYGGSAPAGQWTHIAMTYETNPTGTTQVRLYQNGVEVTYRQTDTIPAGTAILTNTGSLNIGCLPIGGYYYYEGLIDELRILGSALTPAEIAADGLIPPNNVLDASENANHGTPVGGAAWTAGKFSNGLVFDGSSAAVTVPHAPTLNPGQALTMEMWVNPSLNKQSNYLAVKMTPAGSDYAYGIYLENGEIQAFIRPASSGTEYYANGGTVPLNTWTHLAMTYELDATESTHIRLYQNGAEVAYTRQDSIPAGTSVLNNTGPLSIGCLPWVSGNRYYGGLMDEVRMLSRALSPAEIAEDYGRTYKPAGHLTSVLIPPPAGGWKSFYANDTRPAGTTIAYAILDEAGGILLPSVNPGDNLSALGTASIRLYGELSTSDPASTPVLDEWGVSTGCNADDDCDGICNAGESASNCTGSDNCASVPNAGQEDTYPPQGNGCGNACECEGNFDGDADQDGTDAFTFKQDFGRSIILNPCTEGSACNGDFVCDHDVDGTDAFEFKKDFGRGTFLNPCPNCAAIPWCEYP